MSELDARCLDLFPRWLETLSSDVQELGAVLADDTENESARLAAASAVNYLFKSLDLIPDGIEDLGFLDDAFVFRVAAAHAKNAGGTAESLERLAGDVELIRDFLGAEFDRLDRFVDSLGTATVRQRAAEDLVHDTEMRSVLLGELRGWAEGYHPPPFPRDEKNLIKLRAFLKAKLPS